MGCIYLLYDDDGNGYIGKTTNLKQRLIQHKHKLDNNCRSRLLNNFECLVIEEFDDENDLDDAEQFYYDLYKGLYGDKIVNCKRPLQSVKEYYENNKQQIANYKKEWSETHKEQIAEGKKKWYKKNKDKLAEEKKKWYKINKEQILEQKKEWYKINKEQIKEQKKEYRETHKEQILEQKKEYYKINKEQILERYKQKITCECGSVINYGEKTRHSKSKKHQNYLSNNN